jgi:hypothetical protein
LVRHRRCLKDRLLLGREYQWTTGQWDARLDHETAAGCRAVAMSTIRDAVGRRKAERLIDRSLIDL